VTGSRPSVGVPPERPIEPPEPESVAHVGGRKDDRPAPVSVDEYEELARGRLPRMAFDYFAGGAGEEWTLRENRAAFHRWVLRPRVLVDVSERDMSTTVLGTPVPFPVLVAPTALMRMADREGEVAAARAAAAEGTVMVLSTIASATIEEVAEAAPEAPRWFQLYVHRDRELTRHLVERAVAAGYRALVVTVDAPLLGLRDRDSRNRFATPPGVGLSNVGARFLPDVEEGESGLFAYVKSQQDPGVTWDDIGWLRSLCDLPIVLKGIVTAEDGALASEAGVDGIVVSNHGGRQLDGTIATLDALSEVAEASGRCEVFLDGGVRRGSDVLKALALGARAVLVGRPVLWGLAVGGEAGARHVLHLLREDLDVAMAIAGCRTVDEITPSLVRPAPR
jgi:4-hydroxymandelate oxidase